MAGEIFIADKKTLDSVKQDTEYLKTKSGADYVDTKFLQMDVFKGLNVTVPDLEKFFEEKGDTVTVVDVVGKGYIETLNFQNASASYRADCNVHVILTVDDVQYKFAAYTDSKYNIDKESFVGFGIRSDTSPYESIDSTNIYEILSTWNDLRNGGFKFNKNCKIQLKKLGTVLDVRFKLWGGVIIG